MIWTLLNRVYAAATGRHWKWPTVRAQHLKRNPTCAACGTRAQLQVHHKQPFWKSPELELDPSNLITLCADDHLTFGHLKNWSSWNDAVDADCAAYFAKVKSRPVGTETHNQGERK